MKNIGKWIGADLTKDINDKGSIVLCKYISVQSDISFAQIKICGLGLYKLFINEKPITSFELAPLETNYSKRVLYDQYDISQYIKKGRNSFVVILGNGRYATGERYVSWRAHHYGEKCLWAEIHIIDNDGNEQVLGTDETWQYAVGSRVENCFYDGERCDSRISIENWADIKSGLRSWKYAKTKKAPCDILEENRYFHINRHRTLKPIEVLNPLQTVYVYSFAENISGWVRVSVSGPKNEKVIIRYAEVIKHSVIDTISNRYALNTDEYVLNGEEQQVFEPYFTLHGFAAVEISTSSTEVHIDSVEAVEVYADIKKTGSFACDNADIQRIHDCTIRSQNAALMSFPMDCPQRDERLGWLGDAHATDFVCLFNYDIKDFYKKWFVDIMQTRDEATKAISIIAPWHEFAHSIDWSVGYVIIVWDTYVFYRDKQILIDNYEVIKSYVEYLLNNKEEALKIRYGDWMSVKNGWKRGEPSCSAELFLIDCLQKARNIAEEIGCVSDVDYYVQALTIEEKTVLEKYCNKDKGTFDDNSQFSLAYALYLDILPDPNKTLRLLIQDLEDREYHLNVGIFGAKYVMQTLMKYRQYDIIVKLILQKTYPSWLNMLSDNTTLSEMWEGKGSRNHCMFGSIDAVLFQLFGGLRVEDNISIEPYFATEINHLVVVSCIRNTMIKIEWLRENRKIQLTVGVDGDEAVMLKTTGHDCTLNRGIHKFVIDAR